MHGLRHARGEYVIIMDADLSHHVRLADCLDLLAIFVRKDAHYVSLLTV